MKLRRVLAAAAATYVLAPIAAGAHRAPGSRSYPFNRCHGIGRGEIPDSAVKEKPTGHRVAPKRGDHRTAKTPFEALVSDVEAKPVPDGAHHIYPSPWLKVLGFFAGPRRA